MKLTIEINSLDSELIKFYESNNYNLISDALYHGFKIVKSPTYAAKINHSNDEINELRTQNKELTEKHKLEIHNLNTKLLEQQNIHQISISQFHQRQMEMANQIESDVKIKFNEEILKLEKKNDDLHNKILLVQENNRNHYEGKFQEYQNTIDLLNQKLEKRNSILSNSSKKGLEGEKRTLDILNQMFPQAEIYDTHKETANGDFRIVLYGIQILYENKNFSTNVPKRDIEKFKRDVIENDCHCGIMCSENGGIACKDDLDMELLGSNKKPVIYVHKTNSNLDKVRISILILTNILQNKLELNTSTLLQIKENIQSCENILKIYNSNKKNINQLEKNNNDLAVLSKKMKIKLEEMIKELNKSKSNKQKCEFCSGSFVNLTLHQAKCKKKHNNSIMKKELVDQ